MESFAQLFEESLARQEMRQGEVITAEVMLIDRNFVVVNAGLKSESYVPLEEFLSDQGELEVKVGDFVQVAIEMLEDGYGATRLSRDRAKRIAAWNFLEQALNDVRAFEHRVDRWVGVLVVDIPGRKDVISESSTNQKKPPLHVAIGEGRSCWLILFKP